MYMCVCVLQPQDVKHRGRKRKEGIMDENVPPEKKPNVINSFGTPVYRAKARRQEQSEPSEEISCDLTANLENATSTSDQVECVTIIGYEKLTEADLDRLRQERGWLND